jgi:hypothetical protein
VLKETPKEMPKETLKTREDLEKEENYGPPIVFEHLARLPDGLPDAPRGR